MSFSVPSNDNAVYAEVHKIVPNAANKFELNANVCYEGVELSSSSSSKISSHNQQKSTIAQQDSSNTKKVFLLLFVLVIALLLGTVCTCIAFALEISNLKASMETTSRQLEIAASSIANQLLNMSLDEDIRQLNFSIASSHQQLSQYYFMLENITQELNMTTQLVVRDLYSFHPVTSCAALPQSAPSGHYWVRSSNGPSVQVYCDMTRSCGGVSGGWTRVAELDMTNSSHQCPSGFLEYTDSNRRTCIPQVTGGCSSVTFSISASLEYFKLCGRVQAYQVGHTDGFLSSRFGEAINGPYVDGISLTHGDPRQHIWTFASALHEVSTNEGNCPCIHNSSGDATLHPAFVGGDYFCDTGSERATFVSDHFYGDDPLWDGAGCGPLNTCCSFNNPPWFYKQLPHPTTDEIEMRVCLSSSNGENIATETVEIYIQ